MLRTFGDPADDRPRLPRPTPDDLANALRLFDVASPARTQKINASPSSMKLKSFASSAGAADATEVTLVPVARESASAEKVRNTSM